MKSKPINSYETHQKPPLFGAPPNLPRRHLRRRLALPAQAQRRHRWHRRGGRGGRLGGAWQHCAAWEVVAMVGGLDTLLWYVIIGYLDSMI